MIKFGQSGNSFLYAEAGFSDSSRSALWAKEMGLDCFEPLGAFYVFPSIKRLGMSSEEFCEKLLFSEKLAVVPGTAFGDCGEGFLRISYAYSVEKLKIALERLERFVERHKKS